MPDEEITYHQAQARLAEESRKIFEKELRPDGRELHLSVHDPHWIKKDLPSIGLRLWANGTWEYIGEGLPYKHAVIHRSGNGPITIEWGSASNEPPSWPVAVVPELLIEMIDAFNRSLDRDLTLSERLARGDNGPIRR